LLIGGPLRRLLLVRLAWSWCLDATRPGPFPPPPPGRASRRKVGRVT